MTIKNAVPHIFGAVFLLLWAALILIAARYFLPDADGKVTRLALGTAEFDSQTEQVSLPHDFSDLAPRTAVTVTMDVWPDEDDYLYVKSVYAPLKVYADGVLLCQYGQDGTYPSIMEDPATHVALIRLPVANQVVHLRFEYLSPVGRDTLTVHPTLLGSQSAIVRSLLRELGFPFLFSVLLLFSGILMILVALFISVFERRGIAFLWLGLFSLSVGSWTFGECNLTGLFLDNPTLLYFLAFTGLFAIPVPLIHFGLYMVDYHDRRPMLALEHLMGTASCAALALQLFGVVPFERSMYLFHVLDPLALCLFAGYLLYETLYHHNTSARRFLAPMTVLAVFAILEAVNYKVHFTYVLSLFFQMGVMIFVLMCGAVAGLYVRDAMRLKSEKQRMGFEMKLMEYRVEEQGRRQKSLLENQEKVRQQRHDLRHQLAVIHSFSERSDNAGLDRYLDSLVAAIPAETVRAYCENDAVNAIVSHYAAEAERDGIELDIRLAVPTRPEHITDSDLCVIFGNLMENAIEACGRMREGKKFIRLRSRIQFGTLTVAMDNSFDGLLTKRDGMFLSSKRNEIGTGLRSVSAIAGKYGGGAAFEAEGGVFESSVYVTV